MQMPPYASPSWPALGQVQKLTDMFEEKSLPKPKPKTLKNRKPMPKLKPELLVRFEVKEKKQTREVLLEPMPSMIMIPLPKPIADDFYEVQTFEDLSALGDGEGDTGARPRGRRTYPDFEHFIP